MPNYPDIGLNWLEPPVISRFTNPPGSAAFFPADALHHAHSHLLVLRFQQLTRLLPLSRIAGEGGEASEPGEGPSRGGLRPRNGVTLTLPALWAGPLPLPPRRGRGALARGCQ